VLVPQRLQATIAKDAQITPQSIADNREFERLLGHPAADHSASTESPHQDSGGRWWAMPVLLLLVAASLWIRQQKKLGNLGKRTQDNSLP
jgi:hypothetical protein